MSEEGNRADEALTSREQELRLLVETIPALVWRAGPEGNFEYVNKRVLEYFGASLGDIIGWGWMERVHPDDVAFKARTWLKTFESGNPHEAVCRMRGADGRYRWFAVRGEPLRGDGRVLNWCGVLIDIDDRRKAEEAKSRRLSEHGELSQVVGTNVDVTERKRAVEALREGECKLRQIIETVPSHLWSADPAGEPTQLSQRMLDYSGMRFEDFKHGGWEAYVHPDDYAETARAFYHAIQTGTSYQGVMRLRRADGEFRWHDARCEPLRDQQGRIIQWYGLTIDIDEVKKAEDRLRRSEAFLAEAQRLSKTGSRFYDAAAKRYVYWSDESYRIWGFDPTQGLPSLEDKWQRIHPDDRDRVWQATQEALRQKKNIMTEFRILLPNGTIKYVETTNYHVFSPLGELVEYMSTTVDLTERKRAEQRLRQLESDLAHTNRLSMMGELAASLAHEIAQPMATARNNARAAMNFLERSSPDLGEVRGALACVLDDSDRAGAILDRIRDHIKKAPPRKERVDLNKAIVDVIALAQDAIIQNSVSVQTRLTGGLSHVQADGVQLQQVVLNLILNAVEAMSLVKKGVRELVISTEPHEAGGVLVTVRDSGPGIDPKDLDRVFEAFYTTKSSGVGMGLSICRSIINAQGGRLWAQMNPHGGAAFQFTLPSAGEELTNPRPADHHI
jgi:PAS domain S-box-containing protein